MIVGLVNSVEKWVREALDRPGARAVPGVELLSAKPGHVVLALDHGAAFEQMSGLIQATVTTALGTLAAAYGAVTAFDLEWDHELIEQSVQFVAPARGRRMIAEGRIVGGGRSIRSSAADIFVEDGEGQRLCATLMAVSQHGKPR